MSIDWTKLDTAAKKAERAAAAQARADELVARAQLRNNIKDEDMFDDIKAMSPNQFDAFVDDKVSTIPPAQRPVIRFLMKVAYMTVREMDD